MPDRPAIEVRYLEGSTTRESKYFFYYSPEGLSLEFEQPAANPRDFKPRLTRVTLFDYEGSRSIRMDLLPTSELGLEVFRRPRVFPRLLAVLKGNLYCPFTDDLVVEFQINADRRVTLVRVGASQHKLYDHHSPQEALPFATVLEKMDEFPLFHGANAHALARHESQKFPIRAVRPRAPLNSQLVLLNTGSRKPLRGHVVGVETLLPVRHIQADWLELGAQTGEGAQDGSVRVVQMPLTADLSAEYEVPQEFLHRWGASWLWVVDGLPFSCVREAWNKMAGRYLRALEMEQSATFLPKLTNEEGTLRWRSLFVVKAPRPEALETSGTVRAETAARDERNWVARWLSIQPVPDAPGDAEISLEFPRLPTHLGSALQVRATMRTLDRWTDGVASWTVETPGREDPGKAPEAVKAEVTDLVAALRGLEPGNRGIRFGLGSRVALQGEPSPQTRLLRFGALDLIVASPPGDEALDEKDTSRELWLVAGSPIDSEAAATRFSFRGDVSLEGILPSGQDAPTDSVPLECSDRRTDTCTGIEQVAIEDCLFRRSPIVIPFPMGQQPGPGKLYLNVQESRETGRPPELYLELYQQKSAADPNVPDGMTDSNSVALLDTDPFLVAMIEMPPFHKWATAESGLIASWRTATGWVVRSSLGGAYEAHPFKLVLPSPAVGETMERYRTLREGELADFRLSPPARFEYGTSLVPRNFSEAPWNLRRLLEGVSDGELGIATGKVQFELFYGLHCEFNPENPRLGVRLSEIVARVGRPAAVLPGFRWGVSNSSNRREGFRCFHDEASSRWLRFRRQLAARLAILEPWRPELEVLELKDGLRCRIRLPGGETPNGAQTSERDRSLDADLAHPLRTKEESCGDNESLCGGITWGFESNNIYDAVLRLQPTPNQNGGQDDWPKSSSARARGLAFSSLGAWGQQRVGFDQDLSVFETGSAMGRAYSYRLERIGRIGTWWNKARHVIVYERTVAPSRQFACDQNQHLGRPVLRKVREFIEILEPTRRYPEDQRSDARKNGPILACSFGGDDVEVLPRYNVKSAWGGDLSTVDGNGNPRLGWKVPLWRRDAAPPDLYPKPIVRLQVAAHIDGERGVATQVIDNPEDLVFYTDTTPREEGGTIPVPDAAGSGKADPDDWPPIGSGIDFVDRPRPVNRSASSFTSREPVSVATPDQPIPSGLGACTFRLAPSNVEVDIVANRQRDPIGARLGTVTLMRANPLPAAEPPLAEQLQGIMTQVIARLPKQGPVSPELAGRLKAGVDAKLKDFRNALTEAQPGLAGYEDQAKAALTNLEKFERETSKRLGDALTTGNESLEAQVKEEIRKHRERWENRTGEELRALEGEIRAALELQPWIRTGRDGLHLLRSQPGNSVRLVQAYFDAAQDQVEQAARVLDNTLEALALRAEGYAGDAEAQGRWLDGQLSKAASALTSVRARVASLAAAQGRQSDDLPTPDLGDRFARKFLVGLDNASAAIEELRRQEQLTVELVRAELKGQQQEVETIGTALIEKQRELSVVLDGVEVAVLDQINRLEEAAARILTADGSPGRILSQELDWNNEIEAVASEIVRLLGQLQEEIPDWISSSQERLTSEIEEIALGLGNLASWIDDDELIGDLPEQANHLNTEISRQIQQLDNLANKEAADVRRQLEEARTALVKRAHEFVDEPLATLAQIDNAGQVLHARAEPALNLLRAFGEPPKVAGLDLDRPEVAYFYDEAEKVGITPVIARAQQVSRVGEALKPLGIAIPTTAIGAKLLPEELSQFELSDILPNVGGLDLSRLFSGVRMPAGSQDGVDIRHGYDRETSRAWLRANLNVELGGTQTIFAVGPLALRVDRPRFTGEVRVEGGLQQRGSRSVRGEVSGDWEMVVGGARLVRFRQTRLIFDDDAKLRFDLAPERVELEPTVQFIERFLQTLSDPDSGFSLAFTGTAVRAQLLLPIPDISLGAFGITGLSFLAALELHFAPSFRIGMQLSLAHRQRPFALTIFVLGGGGFLEARALYDPSTGKAEQQEVFMAITASAGLSIALGPISGGVFVYFGVTGQYVPGGSGLDLGILIAVRGHVSVLGIASASVGLTLRGYYQGDALVGEGRVDIKIKICWCFELEVNESVTYTLAGNSKQTTSSLAPSPVARLAQVDITQGGGLELDEEGLIEQDINRFSREYVGLLI